MSAKEPGRLESWKEIGEYLQRDVRTLGRWEKEEGLPVHRHSHKSRSSVYAYKNEIDGWRASRKVAPERPPARPLWKIPAFAVTMLLCLVMGGNGLRPVVAAQARKQSAHQVLTGSDARGRVSVDGRYLSFMDQSTGDLAIRDLRTGKTRRLTDTGGWEKSGDNAGGSIISPDGSMIAYDWAIQKESRTELRVLPLKGSQAPRSLSGSISDDLFPLGWIPDGKQLLVLRNLPDQTVQLGLIKLQDGAYSALKVGGDLIRPTLSPDGRWVAYGLLPERENQPAGVYLIGTDGTGERLVVPSDNRPVAWSPDSSRLYFLSNRTGNFSLWSVVVASGKTADKPELVRPDIGLIDSLGMTRDGTLYYLVRGANRTNIYSAELGSGGAVTAAPVLASDRRFNSNLGASVSPDGKSLAYYISRMTGATPVTGSEQIVVVRSLETGAERDFVQDQPLLAPAALGPMWFPDSRSLLMATYEFQKPGAKFFRLDSTSANKELVLDLARAPVGFKLSPDGKALYYTDSDPRGSSRLMRYDLSSRRETELKAVSGLEPEIAISPDGSQLAYAVQTETATIRYLVVIPAAGGPAKEIFRGPRLCTYNCLAWSPDGKFLLFSRGSESPNGPGSLWRVLAAGGTPELTGLSQPGLIRGPEVHPSGKRIFYTVTEPNANEVWALENFIPDRR